MRRRLSSQPGGGFDALTASAGTGFTTPGRQWREQQMKSFKASNFTRIALSSPRKCRVYRLGRPRAQPMSL
jgi:hypothetical protein